MPKPSYHQRTTMALVPIPTMTTWTKRQKDPTQPLCKVWLQVIHPRPRDVKLINPKLSQIPQQLHRIRERRKWLFWRTTMTLAREATTKMKTQMKAKKRTQMMRMQRILLMLTLRIPMRRLLALLFPQQRKATGKQNECYLGLSGLQYHKWEIPQNGLLLP